jgi:hypothetical protein
VKILKHRKSKLILFILFLTVFTAVLPVNAYTRFIDEPNLQMDAQQGNGEMKYRVYYRDTPTTFLVRYFIVKNKDAVKPSGRVQTWTNVDSVANHYYVRMRKYHGVTYVQVSYDENGGGDSTPWHTTIEYKVPKRPT